MSNRLQVIQSIFDDLIQNGSTETLMSSVTEDVLLRNAIPKWAPFGGQYQGKAGILDYFARVDTVLEMHSLRANSYFDNGDQLVVLGDEVLRIKATGEEFFSEWCTVFSFRDECVSAILVIEDHLPLCGAIQRSRE